MENKIYRDVIYLASCAVNKRIPDKDKIADMNMDAVYSLAKKHMIMSMVAYAVESAGISDKRSVEAIAKAVRKSALFDMEWDHIRKEFEDAHIWYMPLKGAILKGMYPKYGMREFSDFDILVDRTRVVDVRNIMEGQGFNTEKYAVGNHDVYFKSPCLNFEMHSALFNENYFKRFYEYYKDVGQRLISGGYEKHFSNEDLYLYLLVHEYKHYNARGTGIRSLIDTYVFLNAFNPDIEYVSKEAGKLGIEGFESLNRSLALNLFGDKPLSDEEQEMLEYMLDSGTYGTFEHKVENSIRENNNSVFAYMLHRFLVPVSKKNKMYNSFAREYSFFYKYKIFLPVLPFYRTIMAIKSCRFTREFRAIKRVRR